jgi:hypothetical protein
VMTGEAVFLLETRPNGRALFDNDSAFVREGLAGALRQSMRISLVLVMPLSRSAHQPRTIALMRAVDGG